MRELHSAPLDKPPAVLTEAEARAMRENVLSRQRALWRKGAQLYQLEGGGPLDGVTMVHDPNHDASGVIGWCQHTDRGIVMASYRLNRESGCWLFDGLS